MKIDPIAVTYSRTLVELASEEKILTQVLEEIRFLSGLYRDLPVFQVFLESPSIDSRSKKESLEKIFRGNLSDLVLNFLEIMIDKKRQFLLPQIFIQFEVLYDELEGRVRVDAISAVALGAERKDKLQKVLQKKLKKNVVLENRVDADVLGGLVLRFGDLVADDSLRTSLKKMAGRLESVKLGSELVHEN